MAIKVAINSLDLRGNTIEYNYKIFSASGWFFSCVFIYCN